MDSVCDPSSQIMDYMLILVTGFIIGAFCILRYYDVNKLESPREEHLPLATGAVTKATANV